MSTVKTQMKQIKEKNRQMNKKLRKRLAAHPQVPPMKYFKLSPHQYLIKCSHFNPLGIVNEKTDLSHFKLLRDPVTKRPVGRRHTDLKPGEISLVLR